MFSFFSAGSKQTDPIVQEQPPKVVDFNTIQTTTESIPSSSTKKSRFSLWPFSSSSSASQNAATKIAANNKAKLKNDSNVDKEKGLRFINDSTNKVIAMKKIQGVEDEGDDDFIDIQVRKLSYAEVAALEVNSNTNSGRSKKPSKFATGDKEQDGTVIDQEAELEKSVTDLEFADNYSKSKKFSGSDREICEDAIESAIAAVGGNAEDEGIDVEDIVFGNGKSKKMPKRFAKNGKYIKKREAKS